MGGLVGSVSRRAPQAISTEARLNISGLRITHSWAQDITQGLLHVSKQEIQFVSGHTLDACKQVENHAATLGSDTRQMLIRKLHMVGFMLSLHCPWNDDDDDDKGYLCNTAEHMKSPLQEQQKHKIKTMQIFNT